MTDTAKRITCTVSTLFAIAGALLFGDGFRLMAKVHETLMTGIFMSAAGLIAAPIFAYRANEDREEWPLSILKAGPPTSQPRA